MAIQLFRLLLFTLFAVMLFEMGGWRWVSDTDYVSGYILWTQASPLIIEWDVLLVLFNGAYYGIEQINRYFYSPILEWFLLGLSAVSAKIAFCAGTEMLSRFVAAIGRGTGQHLSEPKSDAQ